MGSWFGRFWHSRSQHSMHSAQNTEPEWSFSEWVNIDQEESRELEDVKSKPVAGAAAPCDHQHTRPTAAADPEPGITPKERRQYRGRTIANALQCHFVQLINTIDIHTAADHLFEAKIISDDQYDMATKEAVESTKNKASKLIALLIRKLEANPHMFQDVCTAFERAGAVAIISEVKAEVQPKSKVTASPSQSMQQKPMQKQRTYQESGEQVEMTECASRPDHFSAQCLGHFTETQNVHSIIPSPLHIICASIPQGRDEATKRKRKEDMAELQRQLGEGANCRSQDEDGNTPLHIATSKGDAGVVRIILCHIQQHKGLADVINIQNNEFQTVLHISTIKKFPMVTALVCNQKGCNPHKTDKEKKTPLHYACSSGILDLVKPLLKCCSSRSFINATDDDGDTALHLSTRGGFIEIMKLLRENKADPGWKNLKEETPIDIACDSDYPKAVKVLTNTKYAGRFTLLWKKKGMRNSSSYAGFSPHRSGSTHSVNSSACSDVGRYTGLRSSTCSISENDVNDT